MKLKKLGQSTLAVSASVGLGLGLISCSASNTVDYLYLLSSKNNPGQINVYRTDSQTGALTQISNSPYPAGRNPVGIVIAPNGKTLYVINHDDNTVEAFGIGTDAKLYPQHTYTTPGSEPVAIGINPAGTFLFVVDFYQPVFTDQNPGPGAIVVYPILSDSSLGTNGTGPGNGLSVTQTLANGQSAGYFPLDTAPSAVNVLAGGSTVYVAETLNSNPTACSGAPGRLVGLSVDSSGVLAPVNGSPYCAGTTPNAIASHPTGSFVYVTDSAQNQLLGYNAAADGTLTPFAAAQTTDTFPDGVTIDPRGLFMYVVNRSGGDLLSYSIDTQTGIASRTGSYSTGAFPQCVIVEPALAQFVYTADFGGAGSTGYKLDPATGLLTGTRSSPYPGTGQATCVAATSHGGSHTIAQ